MDSVATTAQQRHRPPTLGSPSATTASRSRKETLTPQTPSTLPCRAAPLLHLHVLQGTLHRHRCPPPAAPTTANTISGDLPR